MTPPETPKAAQKPEAETVSPAVSSCLVTMRKRPEFLRAAKARRQVVKGFILQARKRDVAEADPSVIRVGYTCSKKVGNAVARNRAKRRLRALAREMLPTQGQPGWDYVLIGRAGATQDRLFADLQNDLDYALRKIHRAAK